MYVEVNKTEERFNEIEIDMIRLDVRIDNLELKLIKLMNDIKEAIGASSN